MPDIVSPNVRSRMMAGIRGKNTKPEMFLRSRIHAAGLRFRIHDRSLPGNPDMVFKGKNAVLFFHGCFWHGHDCARGARVPKQNRDYWTAKVARNRARDAANGDKLEGLGWRVETVWECELKDATALADRLSDLLK